MAANKSLVFVFLNLTLSFLFIGCDKKEGGVLVFEDRYWLPAFESSTDVKALLDRTAGELGFTLTVVQASQEKGSAEELERVLAEKKPKSVLFGSFIALEIQALAEKNPAVAFIALDAPAKPPAGTPFRWVRFTKEEAFREIGLKVRRLVEGQREPKRPVLSILGPDYLEVYKTAFEPAAFIDPQIQAIRFEVSVKDSQDSLKTRLAEELKRKPPLCLLFAGSQTAFLLGLLKREEPLPVIVADRGKLPDLETLPVLFSLEKDYDRAILEALKKDLAPGQVLDVPMTVREGTPRKSSK